jgi:carnosine N-methyltransferase
MLEKHINYSDKFTKVDELIAHNQELCSKIVDNALDYYHIDRKEFDAHVKKFQDEGKSPDKVSVSQSLKHIVRDWSVSGGPYERDASFKCLISTLNTIFLERSDEEQVKVLLPGAGLGRLGFDIADLGGKNVSPARA